MSIGDGGLESLRQSRPYRAALWLGRLLYLWALVCFLLFLLLKPPGPVILVMWLPGLAIGAVSVPLMRRAGIPVRRLRRWDVRARAIQTRFYRDVLWLYRW